MKKVTADVCEIQHVGLEDAKNFINWAYLMRDKTQFDIQVMKHPRMCMTRALIDGQPSLYVPIQPVLMFDALTPDPAISNRERVLSMLRISELLETKIMPDTGMYDAYFYTNDAAQAEISAKNGWEEVKGVRLMRKRISAPKEPSDV